MLNMSSHLNSLVKQQVCYQTILSLSDKNLMDKYLNTPSVQKKCKNLNDKLTKYNISNEIKEILVKDIIKDIIPPGTKGAVRGYEFNLIVENKLRSMKFLQDSNKYELCFEKDCHMKKTGEIPDWYIINYENDKKVIGMNQVDLWGGGAQRNRFEKYMNKDDYICVVCYDVNITTNNKCYKLFEKGLMEDRLCWINNLENIIKKKLE